MIIDYGEGVDGIAFCKSLDFTRNMDIWETPDNYDDFMPYGQQFLYCDGSGSDGIYCFLPG